MNRTWALVVMLMLASEVAWAGGTPELSWAQHRALQEISRLSDRPSSDQVKSLPILIDALYSNNAVIAEAAASEIAQLRVDIHSAIPHVIERMRRVGGRDASLYAMILAKIGSVAVPALHAALDSEDYGLRQNVCKAFTLMDSPLSGDNRCHYY